MLESCEVAVSSSGADADPKHILQSPGLIRPLKEAQKEAEEEDPTIKKVWTVWLNGGKLPMNVRAAPVQQWSNIVQGPNQSLFGEKVSYSHKLEAVVPMDG